MFCHNCGTKLKKTAKFCPQCGTMIEKDVLQSSPVAEDSTMLEENTAYRAERHMESVGSRRKIDQNQECTQLEESLKGPTGCCDIMLWSSIFVTPPPNYINPYRFSNGVM